MTSPSKQWHPSREEVKRLMKMVKVEYSLHVLRQNQETVGAETFQEDGLYLVLLSACQSGATSVIEHFVENHLKLFTINQIFKYGYTQEWHRPVNYVTIIEDTIGYRDEKREERTDTLLSFTQKYCKCNKDEVIAMLQKYGAS